MPFLPCSLHRHGHHNESLTPHPHRLCRVAPFHLALLYIQRKKMTLVSVINWSSLRIVVEKKSMLLTCKSSNRFVGWVVCDTAFITTPWGRSWAWWAPIFTTCWTAGATAAGVHTGRIMGTVRWRWKKWPKAWLCQGLQTAVGILAVHGNWAGAVRRPSTWSDVRDYSS